MSDENTANLNFGQNAPNSAPPGGERENDLVDNQAAIAALLGVDERTFRRWEKKDGAPERDAEGRYNVPKWQAFAATIRRKSNTPDKASAELEGQLIKNQRAKMEYEKELGNLLTVQEVAELLAGMCNAFAVRLTGSRYSLAPLLAGETVPEITKRIGVEHHKALSELSVPDWAKKKVGPPGIYWSKVARKLSALLPIGSPGDGLNSTLSSPAAQ